MPDEPKTDEVIPEIPEDDTIAATLGRQPKSVYDPASGGMKEVAPPEDEPVPDEDAKAAEEEAARLAAEEAAKAKPPEFLPKHQTWEETEKARIEAETRMHTATTETAEERKAREKAEQELADFKAEQERLASEAAKPKGLSEEEQDAIFEKAAQEIAELDRTDPDYLKKYSRIWRKAIVTAGESRVMPDSEKITEDAANRAYEKLQAKQAVDTAKTAEERQREAEARGFAAAVELATKAGLNMADEDSADYIIFDRMSRKMPDELKTPETTLQAQVDWVVNEVRKRIGKVVQMTDAERERTRKLQLQQQNLGRGDTPKPKPQEKPETDTIASSLDRQKEARRARR